MILHRLALLTCEALALGRAQHPPCRLVQRGRVEGADEFEEVGLLPHDDGFVPVLEELVHPVLPAVEGPPQSGVRRDRMQRARPATKSARSAASQKIGRCSRTRTIT
jgi:hypothetical protein